MQSDQNTPCHGAEAGCWGSAAALNEHCLCQHFNPVVVQAQWQALGLAAPFQHSHPHVFSPTCVYVSHAHQAFIQQWVATLEQVVKQPRVQAALGLQPPPDAAAGVCMGVDFHLTPSGPKVIEVNTNAGGWVLNIALLQAQTPCRCSPANAALAPQASQWQQRWVQMFLQEWQLARPNRPLKRLVIVDEAPEQQFLYPEFRLAQQWLAAAGVSVAIADATDLHWDGQQLWLQQQPVDFVYNRLTDFSLSQAAHQGLRQAFVQGAVVLSPNPWHHALYADKRNLIPLGDAALLSACGIAPDTIALLQQGIAPSYPVTPNNAETLWQARKHLFFKPACGYGSKAVYRGDKLTQGTWQQLRQEDYIAQDYLPPPLRAVQVNGAVQALKTDIRAFCYQGQVHFLAARLYQGQTTNFRTEGGGFAPVVTV